MLGLLLATISFATEIPLTDVRWDVTVSGGLADIEVAQLFHNQSSEFIEATYTFPLDNDAAVDDMSIAVGDRVIKGTIKTREAADQAFEKAKREGKVAAKTDQERPNVFTQKIANLPPGQDIVVRLHVVQPVDWVDGNYELTLPLVVGPRFSTGEVTDVAAITPPVIEGDSGLRVDIAVDVETGMPLRHVDSPTHSPSVSTDATGASITLDGARATRDFVLRWSPDVVRPRSAAIQQGGHLLLDFIPPEAPPREQIVPRELIWVVDTSCSMSGKPLDMAKQAMLQALDGMDERDSFLVLNFSDTVSALAEAPLPATPGNIERGRHFVRGYQASGGTQMLRGIEASLALPPHPDRERYVVFLTDGYIGNDQQILGRIDDLLGGTKLFSFGVGSSVNRYLLDEMSRVGRGKVTYVTLDESPADAVVALLDTISRPVLTDIAIDWGGRDVQGQYPPRLPDLFAGQPLSVVAAAGWSDEPITIRGRMGDADFEQVVDVVEAPGGRAVGSTWARRAIGDLERQQHWGEVPEIEAQITSLALEYRLLSRYTSFVAIEHVVRSHTGGLASVDVPVDLPDGVSFETTVSRRYTPPGDPLLTVGAPSDARAVMAVFPWSTAFLTWDELRERWYHRFLVPRDVADGELWVEILVVHADGRVERRRELMIVDAQAPEVETYLRHVDGRTEVVIVADEPFRSIQAVPVGATSSRVRRDFEPDVDAWEHVLHLDGLHTEVDLLVKDRAMNTVVARAFLPEEAPAH